MHIKERIDALIRVKARLDGIIQSARIIKENLSDEDRRRLAPLFDLIESSETASEEASKAINE